LSSTPWGLLPPRMSVLFVTAPRRTGAWLAEAFANDSACDVRLEEAAGAAAALQRLRERSFDALLIGHEPGEFDALELLDAARAGGSEEPAVVLGLPSEEELAAVCFEAGADAYLCVGTATTRTLLWVVARATERHALIRENRRLTQAQRHWQQREQREAAQLLTDQRGLLRDVESASDAALDGGDLAASGGVMAAFGQRVSQGQAAIAWDEAIKKHYRELLRAHVMMGTGNLSDEMEALATRLADAGISAPQAMQLHLQILEELVRGLGSRSARHVMSRADLLVLEVLVQLAERYRLRARA